MAEVVFVEDGKISQALLPFTHLKSPEDLKLGAFSFRERLERLLRKRDGKFFFKPTVLLREMPEVDIVSIGDEIVGVKAGSLKEALDVFERGAYGGKEVEGMILNRPWEIPYAVEKLVEWDLRITLSERGDEFVRLGEVYVHRSVGGRYLDVEGFGLIDRDVKVGPFVRITGAFYVGRGSLIKPFTSIDNSVLSGVCKVAGEISHTVFMPFSNKQHSGFIGHSVVGEWVNIGAGTEVSNLKNTYGKVKVYSYLEGRVVDTGLQFIGTFIGDHTKIGINTTVSTGTVFGVFANITAADSPTPKFVPDFYWTGGGRMRLEKALEMAKRVMERRGLQPSEDYLGRIRRVYESLKPLPSQEDGV